MGTLSASVAKEISAIEGILQEDLLEKGSNPLSNVLAKSQIAKSGHGELGKNIEKRGPKAIKTLNVQSTKHWWSTKYFHNLPISSRTKAGLKQSNFFMMTDIQRAAIPHALCGRDVLGAAKTGSGKTLAFLVPILERLFRSRWTPEMGCGAIVLSPTRELAVQTFEVLRRVGAGHGLSAGLLIGGKEVEGEKDSIHGMNILVATPGRLLQHMDETTAFVVDNIQILVLDEADRILDLGFKATLDAILDNLPRSNERQTMLFSATQTKAVKQLARLSMQADIEFLSVHEESSTATPKNLLQTAIVLSLGRKIDALWSFIKAHLQFKVIVFMSSCKQVQFVSEAFRRLRPGVPLKAIHGRIKQSKRMGIFDDFCRLHPHTGCVLFATDVAARGLDFPSVDWVVQVDIPEDVDTYIHRVGRTARFAKGGKALTFLLPTERDGFLSLLEARKIPLKLIKMNPNKSFSIRKGIEAIVSSEPELKHLAQRSVISYAKSVHLMKNKEIFRVEHLPLDDFSKSLGLANIPRLRFINAREDIGSGEKGGRDTADSITGLLSNVRKVEGEVYNERDEDFLIVKRMHNSLHSGSLPPERMSISAREMIYKNAESTGHSKQRKTHIIYGDDGDELSPVCNCIYRKYQPKPSRGAHFRPYSARKGSR